MSSDGVRGPDEPDLGILFASAWRAYVVTLHGRLAERGFVPRSPRYGGVVRALRGGRHRTLTELAGDLGVTKQAASRLVDDMVDDGLVARGSGLADGRTRPLSLTARGEAFVAAAEAVADEVEAELRAALGVETIRALRGAFGVLVEGAGESDDLRARRIRLDLYG